MSQITDVVAKVQAKPAPAASVTPATPAASQASASTAQVIGLEPLDAPKKDAVKPAPVLSTSNPLHAIKAKLQVCVGQAELSVGELLGAKEGHVVVLDRQLDEAVDLLLNGVVVARGLLVASEGCFAIRITELPVPLKP